MNKLAQAQNTLSKLESEKLSLRESIKREREKIPFGQPVIVGRRNIYKPVQSMYEKQRNLSSEIEKVENRIAKLEEVENFKESNELLKDVHVVGKTEFANIGAKTSVNNLDYFIDKLASLEQQNIEAKAYNKTKPAIKKKTYGADITKLKKKIEMLKKMEEQDKNKKVSEKSQELIDTEKVTQWQKKPIYYFVKGLKKVALELNGSGDFIISSRYPACTEEDKNFIEKLLA